MIIRTKTDIALVAFNIRITIMSIAITAIAMIRTTTITILRIIQHTPTIRTITIITTTIHCVQAATQQAMFGSDTIIVGITGLTILM